MVGVISCLLVNISVPVNVATTPVNNGRVNNPPDPDMDVMLGVISVLPESVCDPVVVAIVPDMSGTDNNLGADV